MVTTSTYTGPNEIQSITTSASDVDEVQLISMNASIIRETQTITTSASAGASLGGSFMLTLDTRSSGGSLQTSGEISYSAPASGTYLSVQRALEAMSNIGEYGIYDVSVCESRLCNQTSPPPIQSAGDALSERQLDRWVHVDGHIRHVPWQHPHTWSGWVRTHRTRRIHLIDHRDRHQPNRGNVSGAISSSSPSHSRGVHHATPSS